MNTAVRYITVRKRAWWEHKRFWSRSRDSEGAYESGTGLLCSLSNHGACRWQPDGLAIGNMHGEFSWTRNVRGVWR